MHRHTAGRGLFVAIVLAGWAASAAAGTSCTSVLGPAAVTEGPLRTLGTDPAMASIALVPGHAYLIEVDERDNDALVEILDSKNEVMARSDHPERRSGTRRAVVTAPDSASLGVRITGREHANAAGTATVRAFDLATLRDRPDCLAIVKALAAADTDYAAGEEIARGRSTPGTSSARDAFLRAAEEYSAAERALATSADQPLRGQTALALAGVEYFGLQDWAKTADWGKAAAEMLGGDDPYRRARAEALAAAAWIEIGSSAPVGRPVPGYGVRSTELLTRARTELQRLSRFHMRRGERYDAGLQLTNIGLTYLYEGRYLQCVTAFTTSSRLFGSIHEPLRRAQAWQNRALCLWGLGRLPEALRWFRRALTDIGPEPYPSLYIGVITNTALAHYALGHFDESLRLYDRALAFTQRVQSRRDEAYCLYGIGMNYYALGDRTRARGFLERARAIRTVALDGRGRMATLRALATIDAEQGRVDDAIASDREALGLAVDPSAIERIRIQLAAHTAAAGHRVEAKAQLDEVLSTGAKVDPVIHAEALLQHAVVLREMGRPREALADLAVARPRLHRFGSVTEEFEAYLEQARALRLVGQPHAALAAVERALGQADAVRLQTANPELRAQLQTPLRLAYDLKIELLRARYEVVSAAGRKDEANTLAAAAFATADASRAHSFADVAAQKYSPAVRQALASEFRRREELYRELSARRFALEARLDRSGSGDPRARHLMHDIAELEREVDAVNTLIATRATPVGRPPPGGSERASLAPLPADTVLVSYWLGSESAYAWVVSAAEIRWAQLPSPAAIAEKVAAFHHSLTRLIDMPPERRREDARALYELIIRPIEPWLSGVRQWVIIPDGALDYVPFAALRGTDGKSESFVAMQHDVAFTPAAWMLDTRGTRAEPHERRGLLLVADPVYQADDPRLAALEKAAPTTQASTKPALDPARRDYRRLAFTAREAAQILAEFPPAEVDQLVGLDATRERLLSLDWSKYRFIHIATHGIVDAQVPQLSALILGSYDASGNVVDGAVRVADLSLETLKADVAVFSACDTALGREVPSEGLVGISSTVLARGARAVVASLWPVSDEIGARLMTEFYRHLLHDSMSAPAALGAAMRSVVSRDGSADPALWAAFQVSVVALGPGLPTRNAGTAEVPAYGQRRPLPWRRGGYAPSSSPPT
ncbi:MAG: CHAT domain-containing protein [Gammaproteobacteria bacterium]|nr:MAG: CHAT domain-containing protein [Gammaproteobacteria bacterium]